MGIWYDKEFLGLTIQMNDDGYPPGKNFWISIYEKESYTSHTSRFIIINVDNIAVTLNYRMLKMIASDLASFINNSIYGTEDKTTTQ